MISDRLAKKVELQVFEESIKSESEGTIFVARLQGKLSRDEYKELAQYLEENLSMRYQRIRGGFVSQEDPTVKLCEHGIKTAMATEKVVSLFERLDEGVRAAFSDPEAHRAYLRLQSALYEYSALNAILIGLQDPQAIVVSSIQKWNQIKMDNGESVRVKPGEKGIKIIYPVHIQSYTDPGTGVPVAVSKAPAEIKKRIECGEIRPYQRLASFRWGSVFDVRQTTFPLSQLRSLFPQTLVSDEGNELFEAAKEYAQEQGYRVQVEPMSPARKGYCAYGAGLPRIALNQDNALLQNAKTLLHELAHADLHLQLLKDDPDRNRNMAEVEAESIAFVVCSYFGLDTSDYSFAYIKGYSDHTLESLKQSSHRIQSHAHKLISFLSARIQHEINPLLLPPEEHEKSVHIRQEREPEIER